MHQQTAHVTNVANAVAVIWFGKTTLLRVRSENTVCEGSLGLHLKDGQGVTEDLREGIWRDFEDRRTVGHA